MKNEDLRKIINNFKSLKILVIGDVMIDSYLWGEVSRISPEAPVPIVSCNKREERLGGASNVALNLKTLGATPIMCSVTGNDEKASLFKALLNKRDMTSDGIIINPNRITTIKTRIIGQNQQLLRVDEETVKTISEEDEKKLIKKVLQYIENKELDAIVFQDYDKGVITGKLIKEVVDASNNNGLPILADPKKRNFNEYRNITLFKPNYKEFVEGLKIDIKKSDFDNLFKVSKQFLADQNIKYLLLTLSELGVFICDCKNYKVISAEKREIADVSGAGDTVASMAVLCLASGLDKEEIAELSNQAGGLVCEKVGVVPIDPLLLIKD